MSDQPDEKEEELKKKKNLGWLAGFRQKLFDKAKEEEAEKEREEARRQKKAEAAKDRGTLKKAAEFLYNITSELPGFKRFYKAMFGKETADTYYVKPFSPGDVNNQKFGEKTAGPTMSISIDPEAKKEADRQRRVHSSNQSPGFKTPHKPTIAKGVEKGQSR